MAEARIPVDLLNPGQVFACLGLLEASDLLLGDARGCFDWSNESDVRFVLRCSAEQCPVRETIRFLCNAEVTAIAPQGTGLSTEGWGVVTRPLASEDRTFPFPLPSSPATLPALLSHSGKVIPIAYWGEDSARTGLDNAKFWAGAGGYPGAALAEDALELIKQQPEEALLPDPLNLSARQSSSFRFDWRRDYIPLDIGFSLNAHPGDRFSTVGYPLVEILAAIGLTNARPKRVSKLEYFYGVIAIDPVENGLDPVLIRAALGTCQLPYAQRFFRMRLDWPGQENQARCVTTVEEITDPTIR